MMTSRSANKYDVLVTGADQRQGLAIIRALGKEGVRVFAAGAERRSIGFYSRFARGGCQYPPPADQKEQFVEVIAEVIARHRIPVLFPTIESSVIAVDEHRERLTPLARLMLTPRGPLHIALDKQRTLQLARTLRIPIPETCLPKSVEEALDFAAAVGYPVVLKRRAMPSFRGADGKFDFKVSYAWNAAELRVALEEGLPRDEFPLVQRYCPGVKAQLGVLRAGGEFLGLYQWKGEREYPPTGGVTCLHLSARPDPDLLRWSTALLEAMDWEGIAGVEFRVDEQTGAKTLMEVNGRAWASISGAIRLGLNFPYAYYRYVLEGAKVRLPTDYAAGVRHRYLKGDLNALFAVWREPALRPFVTPGRRREILFEVLKDFRPGVQSESFDAGDLVPFLVEYGAFLGGYSLRALKKAGKSLHIWKDHPPR